VLRRTAVSQYGLGATKLWYGAKEINYLIDSVQADGIFLHFNLLQEAVQPEGDTNFKGLIQKLKAILPDIKKPVIIKEVGTGMDMESAGQLRDTGVEWLDVSGSGGVSWVAVEGYRRKDDLGEIFQYEGIPTDVALRNCSQINGLNLIAGGGLRSGLDIAKAVMLGARLGTAAKPLLAPALKSSEACQEVLDKFEQQLKVAMFACGVKNLTELATKKLG
jgi:isopentenyl-diphosphate Delta-isomerase